MAIRQLVLLAGIASTLMAQGVRVNGGVLAGFSVPTEAFAKAETPAGDHLGANGGIGAQLGGHLDFNFNPHQQLRFHVTVQGFVNIHKDQNTTYDGSGSWGDWDDDWDDWFHRSSTDSENLVTNWFGLAQLGCDYVHNLTSPSKGPYLLAGIHLNALYKSTTLPDRRRFTFSQSGRVGYRAGVGYTFNRFISVEGHYNLIPVEAGGPNGFGFDALSWISASAVVRFGRP